MHTQWSCIIRFNEQENKFIIERRDFNRLSKGGISDLIINCTINL